MRPGNPGAGRLRHGATELVLRSGEAAQHVPLQVGRPQGGPAPARQGSHPLARGLRTQGFPVQVVHLFVILIV